MNKYSQKLKVGIMGTGWVARRRHLPAYRANRQVEVTSVYNPDYGAAKDFAKKYKIPFSHGDLENFLSQELDVVSICTPPTVHYKLAKLCLERGKHVLMEKPLTMTAEEGQELEKLAREKGLVFYPAHNFLFCRAMMKAKDFLESGKLGEVTGVMGIQWSSLKRGVQIPQWCYEMQGGVFFDEVPHFLYLINYFLKDIRITSAWQNKSSKNLEKYEARIKGEKGEGLLTMWLGAPLSEWLIIVSAERGALVLDLFRDAVIYLPEETSRSPKRLFEVILQADRQIWSQMFRWVAHRLTRGSHLFGHDILVNGFIESILNNQPALVTAEEGWRAVELANNILSLSNDSK